VGGDGHPPRLVVEYPFRGRVIRALKRRLGYVTRPEGRVDFALCSEDAGAGVYSSSVISTCQSPSVSCSLMRRTHAPTE